MAQTGWGKAVFRVRSFGAIERLFAYLPAI
nr:MAG TPA: hypothetical protein [Bacteriophage sp.]